MLVKGLLVCLVKYYTPVEFYQTRFSIKCLIKSVYQDNMTFCIKLCIFEIWSNVMQIPFSCLTQLWDHLVLRVQFSFNFQEISVFKIIHFHNNWVKFCNFYQSCFILVTKFLVCRFSFSISTTIFWQKLQT